MTPLQLAILFLTMATTAWSAAIAAPTAAPTTDHLHHAPPLDNATSSALDIINLALLNLAYTDTIPYGEVPSPAPSPLSYPSLSHPLNTPPPQQVNCRPTDPTHHQLARADAVFRKGIPNLAAGRRDACDVAPAMGRCEHLWCGAKSGIYLCPRTNENRIHFSCSEAALYAFAAVVECRGGRGVMGRTWDGEGRFTVEVWGGRCVK